MSLFALHCSTDDGTQPLGTAGATVVPTAGAGGGVNQGGSSSGMTSGGVQTAGGSVGTAGSFGTAGTVGTAGSVGTAGGSSGGGGGGAGGGSAGASGSGGSGGSGGGGGGSPLFTAVKAQIAKTCGIGKCHNAASGELNFQAMDGMLYQRLTQPVPAGSKHCVGSKAIVANDANSLLLQAIKAKGAVCTNNGANQTIGQMPDECPANNNPCLTPAEQKIFSDWVAAGAPM